MKINIIIIISILNFIIMIGSKFNYLFIDGSYILTRNLYIATKDKTPEEMDPGEVCRITIQTIAKLYKDWDCAGDKPLLIFDAWDKNLSVDGGGGYIRSWMIKDFVKYKGSRKFMTKALLEEMKADPNTTDEEIKKAEHELAVSACKFEAKKIMREQFKLIGIPYFACEGYEFDDICTLASFMLNDVSEKPNCIVTKDSDLNYSLSPNTYQFLIPTKGSAPVFVDYSSMYNKIPQVLKDRGMSLYWYHAYCDSLGITGHNDNLRTIKKGADGIQTILQVMDGDYSNVENVPAFQAQLKSFDLSCFPDIDRVQNMILNEFPKAGHISSTREFRDFCNRNNIQGISDIYYMTFSNRLDQRLFCE